MNQGVLTPQIWGAERLLEQIAVPQRRPYIPHDAESQAQALPQVMVQVGVWAGRGDDDVAMLERGSGRLVVATQLDQVVRSGFDAVRSAEQAAEFAVGQVGPVSTPVAGMGPKLVVRDY